jgi:hypothetical protein
MKRRRGKTQSFSTFHVFEENYFARFLTIFPRFDILTKAHEIIAISKSRTGSCHLAVRTAVALCGTDLPSVTFLRQISCGRQFAPPEDL